MGERGGTEGRKRGEREREGTRRAEKKKQGIQSRETIIIVKIEELK